MVGWSKQEREDPIDEMQMTQQISNDSTSETKNRRVLIVDDNRAIHEDFRKILGLRRRDDKDLSAMEESLFGQTDEGPVMSLFTVDSAFQGQEGLEMVRLAREEGRPYAMAFIDVRMPPGWDGVQTTREIWKIDPEIQVVICTAYSDYSWSAMMSQFGQSDRLVVLKKPFDTIEVAQFAETLTTKWSLALQARRKLQDLELAVQQRTQELTQANQALRTENQERKSMERDSQMMEVQLRQAQKLEAIGQLAAGIAHEINTPTQYVGDNTRFIEESWAMLAKVLHSHQELLRALKEDCLTIDMAASAADLVAGADLEYLYEQIPAAIKATLEGVERVAKIVRAMKEFSHPGSKEKAVANLNKAIESTAAVARNEWKYVADLKLDLDPALLPVPCFLGEFNQSILNLVINAAHAIGDVVKEHPGTKGTITIQTRREGNQVEIRVSDTGGGIPEAVRPRIFEPFFTTKGVGKGSGQGLSIVYASIVKKHGGSVSFETQAGQGTTFILRLPAT